MLKENESRGFPGCIGSVDCMHCMWKNCPRTWAGQFTGKEKFSTIVLEAVATHDLWIWHWFFGLPFSLKDINVVDRSNLLDDMLQGNSPPCSYILRGAQRNQAYYLADGIYSHWATFVQTFSQPDKLKKKLFAKEQEAARKDVERAFGVLQARWHILTTPYRCWFQEDMNTIVKAYVILHNMIIEDQRGNGDMDPVLDEVEHERQGYLIREQRARPNAILSTITNNMIAVRDEQSSR